MPLLRELLGGAGRVNARLARVPAHRGVVVVRAGVDHAVLRVVRGLERFGLLTPEGELQDPHARKSEGIPQLVDVGRDQAEILGDDRLGPQRRGRGVEERAARAGHPAAMLGGGVGRRNLPGGREAAEVVDPEHVEQREGVPQPGDPPGVVLRRVHLPAVERIPPALPRLREVVGRHTRHDGRPAVVGQGEEVGPAPDVGAILRHEDRQVADDRDAARGGPAPQPAPLVVKEKLARAGVVDALGQVAGRGGDHAGLAAGDIARPLRPRAAREVGLERDKERVVVEPPAVLFGELPELVAELRRGPQGKRGRHLVEQGEPRADHVAERHVVGRQRREGREPVGVDQPVVAQPIERDHQRVAREGGERLVRGVAEAGRPQRQHLPVPLPHLGELLEPAVGLGADLADAEPAGERGGVKEDPGGTSCEVHDCVP